MFAFKLTYKPVKNGSGSNTKPNYSASNDSEYKDIFSSSEVNGRNTMIALILCVLGRTMHMRCEYSTYDYQATCAIADCQYQFEAVA